MSSNTPNDRERPVTRKEFHTVVSLIAVAFIASALAMFILLALEIKG